MRHRESEREKGERARERESYKSKSMIKCSESRSRDQALYHRLGSWGITLLGAEYPGGISEHETFLGCNQKSVANTVYCDTSCSNAARMSHFSLNRTHQLKHHIIIRLNNILGLEAIISYPAPAEKGSTVRMRWNCFTLGQFFKRDGSTRRPPLTLPSLPRQRGKKLFYWRHLFVCLFVSSPLFHLCLSRLHPFTPSSIPGGKGSASGTRESPACPFEGKRKKKQKNWNRQLLKCEGGKRWSKSSRLWGRIGQAEMKNRLGMKRGDKEEEKRGKGLRKKSKVVLSEVWWR